MELQGFVPLQSDLAVGLVHLSAAMPRGLISVVNIPTRFPLRIVLQTLCCEQRIAPKIQCVLN